MTKDEALRLALEFISSISPAFICEASHHKKHERHASNEPCPHVAKQKQVYEAIKAALEAKDEPVSTGDTLFRQFMSEAEKAGVTHLIPPQRKPLTDEEIYTEARNHEKFAKDGREWFDRGSFARAIEAKLRSKNHD